MPAGRAEHRQAALHRQGATVAITGRREAELARVAEALGGARVIVAARDADATYVRRALEDVVAELGFSVAEGFSLTKFGAVGVAEHADHPGYGLRLQVNPTSGQLLTRVVADGVTNCAVAVVASTSSAFLAAWWVTSMRTSQPAVL